MLAYVTVSLAALFAAALMLYSGFGLGTLLLPVFALFFPVEIAVLATAVVHGANNVLKVSLLGRYARRDVVMRFGFPAILAAIAGALLLGALAGQSELIRWSLGGYEGTTSRLKLLIGLLMLAFALFELLPKFRQLEFDQSQLMTGGLLSGFFGGLSGHQGALRAAFLAKAGLSPQEFVGTGAMIGLMVDVVRVMTYLAVLVMAGSTLNLPEGVEYLVATGVVSAFIGVLIGKQFLHKFTIRNIQLLTGTLLLVVAVLLGGGWI